MTSRSGREKPPAKTLACRGLVFYRLTFGAHVAYHLPHLADAHLVRNFDLDLVFVDDFGHLADEPAVGDDGIAAPHVLDHVLMRLGLLLLRAQNQEVHNDENERERE